MPVNGDGIYVCIESTVEQECVNRNDLDYDLFVVEVSIFKEGERLGVDELVLKIIFVGYLYGGFVEDLPWKDHILRCISRGPIDGKR